MISLTDEERRQVEHFIRRGKAKARSIMRVHVLLKSADGVEGVLKDKVQQKRWRAWGRRGSVVSGARLQSGSRRS